jgi:hypothetical protein
MRCENMAAAGTTIMNTSRSAERVFMRDAQPRAGQGG